MGILAVPEPAQDLIDLGPRWAAQIADEVLEVLVLLLELAQVPLQDLGREGIGLCDVCAGLVALGALCACGSCAIALWTGAGSAQVSQREALGRRHLAFGLAAAVAGDGDVGAALSEQLGKGDAGHGGGRVVVGAAGRGKQRAAHDRGGGRGKRVGEGADDLMSW